MTFAGGALGAVGHIGRQEYVTVVIYEFCARICPIMVITLTSDNGLKLLLV